MKVRKNSKKLATIISTARDMEVMSLDNGFNGVPVTSIAPSELIASVLARFGFASIFDNSDGTFTLRVHGNLWYCFTADAA